MAAERSYSASRVRGGPKETPHVRGQGRPGEATARPRPGVMTLRSHPEPKARAGGPEEQPRSGGCKGTGGPRGAIPR